MAVAPISIVLSRMLHWSRSGSCVKAKFHYASWFEAGSKLVADQLRTSFEPASVMEFDFNGAVTLRLALKNVSEMTYFVWHTVDHWHNIYKERCKRSLVMS